MDLIHLPKDVCFEILMKLDEMALVSLSQSSQFFNQLISSSPHPNLWKSFIRNSFLSGEYLEERLMSLEIPGEDPARFLCRKMKGKYLVLTNGTFLGSVIEEISKEFKKAMPKAKLVIFTVSDSNPLDLESLENQGFDAIFIITNYGWSSLTIHRELGDAVKKMIDAGVGVVTAVYVGCSWVESLGGEFQAQGCLAIVPNVWKNNVDGSQGDVDFKYVDKKEKTHFLMHQVSLKDTNYTVSLGKAHPEGEVIANLVTESNEEYPFIVTLKKFNGRVVSLNTTVSTEHIPIVLSSLLYVSKRN